MPAHRQQHAVIPCAACGASLRPRPSRLRRNARHFCNATCAARAPSRRRARPLARVTVACAGCGATLERQPYRLRRTPRHYCSFACRSAWRAEHLSGANSWAWRGGTPEYYGPNWRRQRASARRRDGFRCQGCGVAESALGYELHVHHIRPFRAFGYAPGDNLTYRRANALDNLTSLCRSCHARAEPRLRIAPDVVAAEQRSAKVCARCDAIRPRDAFTKNARRRDGLAAYCRECVRSYNASPRQREARRARDGVRAPRAA